MQKRKLFTMRITDAERQKWNALAESANLTLANLIRHRLDSELVDRELPRRQRTRVIASPAVLYAVSRAGNNLNQVARFANRFKSAANAVQIIAALIAIERQLSAALEAERKRAEEGGKDAP